MPKHLVVSKIIPTFVVLKEKRNNNNIINNIKTSYEKVYPYKLCVF